MLLLIDCLSRSSNHKLGQSKHRTRRLTWFPDANAKVYCAYIIYSAMKLKLLTCKVKLGIYWCYINMEDDTFNLESWNSPTQCYIVYCRIYTIIGKYTYVFKLLTATNLTSNHCAKWFEKKKNKMHKCRGKKPRVTGVPESGKNLYLI